MLLGEINEQVNSNPKPSRTYLFEPFSFKPLALVQNNEVFHYHTDHIGTPREITNARAKVVWSSTFKTYGALALAHVNEVDNPLRFQGQYYDSETGLHYNRHRYYDPNCGQFTTQDPIGLLGGMNAYQYAPNPMTWVDPWGLTSKEDYEDGGNEEVSAVKLNFDKNTGTWTTPAGLDYGPGSVHGNRVKHVLDHTKPNASKTVHSVFNLDRKEVLGLIDEAWINKGNPLSNDPGAFVVPMGRPVGTLGETNIKIIIRPGTNKIITAFPFQ